MGSEQHPRIPVLDFSMEDLKPGSDSWLERCRSVRQALEEHGCFVAVYDKVCDELENGVFCSMKELFDLSPETKRRNTYEGSPLKGYAGQIPQIPLHQSLGIDEGTTLEGIQSFTHNMWPKGNHHFWYIPILFLASLTYFTSSSCYYLTLSIVIHYSF